MRQPRSTTSFTSSTSTNRPSHTATPEATSAQASTSDLSIARQLNFVASLPIEFVLAQDGLDDLPTSSTTTTSYYMQTPRISYLALVVPTLIKNQFVPIDQDSNVAISFRDSRSGQPLRP